MYHFNFCFAFGIEINNTFQLNWSFLKLQQHGTKPFECSDESGIHKSTHGRMFMIFFGPLIYFWIHNIIWFTYDVQYLFFL